MDTEKLDKYIKSKRGVNVRRLGIYTRYLLNDRMFAMSYCSVNGGRVLALKAAAAELENYRREYAGKVIPSKELEPLHWNDFLIDENIPDEIILRAVDESYEIFFGELSAHAKKAFDEMTPSYKKAIKNFDLAKVMRQSGERRE